MAGPFELIAEYTRVFRRYIGGRMYVVFGLTLLSSLLEGIGILLLLPLLATLDPQAESLPGAPSVMQDIAEWLGIAGSLPGILAFIALTFLAKGLIKFGAQAYAANLQASLLGQIKARMFDAFSGMDYRFYAGKSTGHFVNLITTQVATFYRSFGAFVTFVSQIVTTMTYLGMAFVVAWRFGLMAVVIGLGLFVLFRGLNARMRRVSRQAAEEAGRQSSLLVQAIQSFKYLVATHQMEPLRGSVLASVQRLVRYEARQLIAQATTGAIGEPLAVFFIVVVVIIQVSVLDQPLAPILVSIVLFNRGLKAVMQLQVSWQVVLTGVGAIEQVDQEFVDLENSRAPDGHVQASPLSDRIEFEGVTFAYEPGRPDVLSSVDLAIQARETVALVGRSGSGKSTIVDMLCLLLRPDAGVIRIDGIDSRELQAASWRRQIGYVSQETVIFDDSIANNISLWAAATEDAHGVRERVREAARQAHIDEFIEEWPEGYDTVVGDRGVRLSGGQRQRLFIARELFKKPRLLVLDEATSALDGESERAIQASIDELRGQMTIVIVAHRLATVRNVDRIYVLERGRIIEQGSYDELRQQAGSRFASYVELQEL
jgi:subfamily B ATP-binding cassette protein MsbA